MMEFEINKDQEPLDITSQYLSGKVARPSIEEINPEKDDIGKFYK